MVKGEIAHYLPQCFQKLSSPEVLGGIYIWEKFKIDYKGVSIYYPVLTLRKYYAELCIE